MRVLFINENTLGHGSYLGPYVQWFEAHPEAGVKPQMIHATPLPPERRRWAETSVPGLRRWGLDFHNARWRLTVSRYVREQVEAEHRREPVQAVVVNTQSMALALTDRSAHMPVFVCLDATFSQLARTPWFAPNAMTKLLLPLTAAAVLSAEKRLFATATRLVPWSAGADASLEQDYGVAAARRFRLPPSVDVEQCRHVSRPANERPRLLFVGGDFARKGGPLLLDCYRSHFAGRADLHLVTHGAVSEAPGVHVHHGVAPGSSKWRELWETADVFIFPSTLDTFGIVLLEAMAFGVPVVSAAVGAARELIGHNERGWLVEKPSVETLATTIQEALRADGPAQSRAAAARRLIEEQFSVASNAVRLAQELQRAVNTGT